MTKAREYPGAFEEIVGDKSSSYVGKTTTAKDKHESHGNGHDKNDEPPPLPFIDMSTWDDISPPPRQWLVVDYIPLRQPALISGEGAIGKSILLLQLLAATSLCRHWLGSLAPKFGPSIYLGAEDEQDEIQRRLGAILAHHEASFSDLIAGKFKALAYAGKDAVLAEFDRIGRIKPTALYERLHREACALQPSCIVIDPVSDVFLGDEIKRDQVRQFGSLMRRLAIDSNSSVIMASHPSQAGVRSGSGISGSTQWHNTVRARAYFKKASTTNDEDEEEDNKPDDGRRELQFLKNQYGPLGHCIKLQWHKGLWLPPVEASEADKANKDAADGKTDELFLTLLRRFILQGRYVSDKRSPTYAPTKFAEQPEAKAVKVSSKALAAAMERLIATGRIVVRPEGPPSRRKTVLDLAAN